MKVIGAGLPRAGTMSMQAALDQLGFPCYHMQEVPRKRGHLKAWNDFLHGRAPLDWRTLFKDYQATVDAPACFYFEELMREFPDAKVILTARDADRWYDSLAALLRSIKPMRPLRHVIPRVRQFLTLADRLFHTFLPAAGDRVSSVATYHRHNSDVKRIVPPDRLLVFDVREGWEPLCAFLEREVPDTEFPHLNTGASVVERVRRSLLPGPLPIMLLGLGVVALAALAWWVLA